MSVMDGSKTSKQSSRSDVGMGSRSHDLGAHLARIESRCSVVTGLKEVNRQVNNNLVLTKYYVISCICFLLTRNKKSLNTKRFLASRFKQVRFQNTPILGHLLMEKSDFFATQMGIVFTANPGWLERFKKRNSSV